MRLVLLPSTLEGKMVHVIEECSEVTKAICKIQRFGINNVHPKNGDVSNIDVLVGELCNLKQAISRLEHEILNGT